MAKIVEFETSGANVKIVVDDGNTPASSQKASTSGNLLGMDNIKTTLHLDEASQVVVQLAETFSGALVKAVKKPSTAEINFGLEASGELGFLVSKVTGKSNFSVKLTWKFD